MIKLAVFDFDSTLMDGETIDFLADALHVQDKVGKITQKAMEGELDFFESLTTRVKYLKGLKIQKAKEICHNLPFINGAKECIVKLKEKNIKVIVFSGGFTLATNHAKGILGYDMDFANELHVKDEVLTGRVGGEMMFSHSKGVMLRKMQELLHVSKAETMCVGDGANDISMFEHSGIKVSFCAKSVLEEKADIKIKTKDLTKILEYI